MNISQTLTSTLIGTLAMATVAAAQDTAEIRQAEFVAGMLEALAEAEPPAQGLESGSSITSGSNYTYNCREARAAVLSGDPLLSSVSGFALGATDMLAGLYCFVGNFRCGCLRDGPVGNPSGFGRALGTDLASCPGNDPLFALVSRAAFAFCGFR